jgi:nucleotide-binding universal stress UspA family protein
VSYKTILVHIDDSRCSGARVNFAVDLALKHNAHLIGLYVVCQDLLRPFLKVDESLSLAVHEAQARARLARAHDHFLSATRLSAATSEWRAPAGPSVHTATLHARHADVIILGQSDPSETAAYIARNFADDVVMSCGRPAILLPYVGRIERFGETVLIAWDGSRAAARAVADALPVLKHARSVQIVTIERHRDEDGETIKTAGHTLAAYLEHHKVRASVSSIPPESGVSTGAALLDVLADTNSGLLVLGAYGHTRLHERFLGGVTRTLLESMTTPVLMSH